VHMQSAVNVELTPEEDMTVTVSANELGDLVEGAIGMVRLPWFAECDGDKCIPIIPIEELRPGLF